MREVGSVYSKVALQLLRHAVQCGAGIMQIGALLKIHAAIALLIVAEALTRGLYDYDVRQCFTTECTSVDTPDCAWQQAELSLYVQLALDCVAYHITLYCFPYSL